MSIRDALLTEGRVLAELSPVTINHEETSRRMFLATGSGEDLMTWVEAAKQLRSVHDRMELILRILRENEQ